jgi:hypothetical protein
MIWQSVKSQNHRSKHGQTAKAAEEQEKRHLGVYLQSQTSMGTCSRQSVCYNLLE